MAGRCNSIVFMVAMVTSWRIIATEELAPDNPHNLNPQAAHVCQTVESVRYTVRESYKHLYTVSTNTWCFAVPPRCTAYSLQERIQYREAVKYHERKKYFCCTGYTHRTGLSYCIPRCDEDCNREEGQGFCTLPGHCVCVRGYSGSSCQSECTDDTWGPNCSNQCTCGSHGSCDPSNGNCICHVGYTGQDCSQPCQQSFGQNCIYPCMCENNSTCSNINGRCTCQPGYYGAYCHKQCADGTHGDDCTQECQCQNGARCDAKTGACNCAAGFKGEFCAEPCDRYHYGRGCTETCACNYGRCDPRTGECMCNMGYGGERCEVVCEPGFYGPSCLTRCRCEHGGTCFYDNQGHVACNCTGTGYSGLTCTQRNCNTTDYENVTDQCSPCDCPWNTTDSCHATSGTCQCKPGYKGVQCQDECTMPFYGQGCSQLCSCPHGDCHPATGVCLRPCHPGYKGDNCNETCDVGTWGRDCTNNCTCYNKADCHKTTGFCNCTEGFTGLWCNETCDALHYGRRCESTCDCDLNHGHCNPYHGLCQCKSGYEGERCDSKCDPLKFGFNCRETCQCDMAGTDFCNHETGTCVCKPSYQGASCAAYIDISIIDKQTGNKDDSLSAVGTPVIVAVSIAAVILLIIIIILVLYYNRRVNRLKDENQRVLFHANHDPQITTTDNAIGLVNPMYEDDNRANERMYPHLTQRASRAPPAPQARADTCEKSCDLSCEEVDDIAREKLQAAAGGCDRPTSGLYVDVDGDESRYTTLGAVQKDTDTMHQDLFSDKFMLIPSADLSRSSSSSERSRSGERSSERSRPGERPLPGERSLPVDSLLPMKEETEYSNTHFDPVNSGDHLGACGVSQPLYDADFSAGSPSAMNQGTDKLPSSNSSTDLKLPSSNSSTDLKLPSSDTNTDVKVPVPHAENKNGESPYHVVNLYDNPTADTTDDNVPDTTTMNGYIPMDGSARTPNGPATHEVPRHNGYITPLNDVKEPATTNISQYDTPRVPVSQYDTPKVSTNQYDTPKVAAN